MLIIIPVAPPVHLSLNNLDNGSHLYFFSEKYVYFFEEARPQSVSQFSVLLFFYLFFLKQPFHTSVGAAPPPKKKKRKG
jgi:hypothetical protein